MLLTNIWLIPLLVASQVTSTQQFCRWRCFSFYWIGKREFAKSMNGIPVTGGPAHLPSHLGRILPSLRRSSIVLLTLFNITFKCSANDKRLSRIIPNCFCELVSGTLLLFKKQSEMVFFAYFSMTCIFIYHVTFPLVCYLQIVWHLINCQRDCLCVCEAEMERMWNLEELMR